MRKYCAEVKTQMEEVMLPTQEVIVSMLRMLVGNKVLKDQLIARQRKGALKCHPLTVPMIKW